MKWQQWWAAVKGAAFTIREATKLAYRVQPRWFVTAVILNSLWGLIDIPSLLISKQLVDTVIEAIKVSNWQIYLNTIIWLIVIQGVLEFARQFTSRLARVYNFILTRRLDATVELMIHRHHGSLDIPTIEDPKFRDRYDRISRESSQRVWGLVRPLFDVIQGLVGLISNMVIMLTFSPVLIILLLLVTVPEGWVNTIITKKEYQLRIKLSGKYRFWGWLSNYVGGGKNNYEVRILGLQNHFAGEIKNLMKGLFAAREEFQFMRSSMVTKASIGRNIFFIGFNIYVFVLALAQVVTLGYAQMIFRAGNSVQNYLQQIINSFIEVYENQLYIKDLLWFLNLKPKMNGGKKRMDLKVQPEIEFRNVWFKYPASKEWVLKNLNLVIKAGEKIAVVGHNGAGKTTLIKLLCGFYQPQKGKILVNGVPIEEYEPGSYRKILSVLFQEFEEYPFSARESIGYGDVRRLNKLEEVKEAARWTKIDGFIEGLKKKYSNPISRQLAGGVEPSKGQWQRIALARALFRKAPILILDEPTSNVDPQAEEEIFNELLNLHQGRTMILISHRFATVRRADRIVVVEDGEIQESGSHEELMKLEGTYARLFRLQAKGYQ